MNMERHKHSKEKWNGCIGKIKHRNQAAAKSAAIRVEEYNKSQGRPSDLPLLWYRCRFCKKYHVGHHNMREFPEEETGGQG